MFNTFLKRNSEERLLGRAIIYTQFCLDIHRNRYHHCEVQAFATHRTRLYIKVSRWFPWSYSIICLRPVILSKLVKRVILNVCETKTALKMM